MLKFNEPYELVINVLNSADEPIHEVDLVVQTSWVPCDTLFINNSVIIVQKPEGDTNFVVGRLSEYLIEGGNGVNYGWEIQDFSDGTSWSVDGLDILRFDNTLEWNAEAPSVFCLIRAVPNNQPNETEIPILSFEKQDIRMVIEIVDSDNHAPILQPSLQPRFAFPASISGWGKSVPVGTIYVSPKQI